MDLGFFSALPYSFEYKSLYAWGAPASCRYLTKKFFNISNVRKEWST